ncbi:MAG TPA: 2-isopropylmalate synthase [Deltaproteobacteria bacterium]|nr:2-isopropylmalate synthase [Deltaproteobacteria bacterium]
MRERERVAIFDTTLRDGEQSAGVSFTLRDKLDIASRLAAAGVDVIEAGFPSASPAELASVRAVAESVRSVSICGLARAVPGDIEAAVEALHGAAHPRVHVFVNASDMHLAHQLRKSREQVIEMARIAVRQARSRVAEVEFSPMDATRSDPEFLAELVQAALEAGALTVNLPDTVGFILPDALGDLIENLYTRVPALRDAVLSFHGQDDLGLATANALTAVRAGARQLEVTVNGIGERAGNTCFEEVVMALRVHGAALNVETGVDTRAIWELSKLVEERSGLPIASNKAIVGKNAFRHASGVHQDGVLKQRETYEVIDPAEIGHPVGTEIVLGKLSGRAGFAARARSLGFVLSGVVLERAFVRFQELADRKREVADDDVQQICDAVAADAA